MAESLAAREKEEEEEPAKAAEVAATSAVVGAVGSADEDGKVEEGSPEFFTDALRLLITFPGNSWYGMMNDANGKEVLITGLFDQHFLLCNPHLRFRPENRVRERVDQNRG